MTKARGTAQLPKGNLRAKTCGKKWMVTMVSVQAQGKSPKAKVQEPSLKALGEYHQERDLKPGLMR